MCVCDWGQWGRGIGEKKGKTQTCLTLEIFPRGLELVSEVFSPGVISGTQPLSSINCLPVLRGTCKASEKGGGGDIALPFQLPVSMAGTPLQAVKSLSTCSVRWLQIPLCPCHRYVGETALLRAPRAPQRQGKPRYRDNHSISRSTSCPAGLNPQQGSDQEKNGLTSSTRGESMESAVRDKTRLQARGIILL